MGKNEWDSLSQYFNGPHASSADNVEITEPVLINELKKITPFSLIDFGCGSGSFCKRVSPFADSVLGVDSSEEMINIAKQINSDDNISYNNKPIYNLDIHDFTVFNAEYVLQFITDDELLKLLDYLSSSNITTILLANDELAFIEATINAGMEKFRKEKEGDYFIHLNGFDINLYPRSVTVLQEMFKRFGFQLKNETHLKFPKAFLERFPEFKEYPTHLPAYMVLIFEKI